MKRFYLLFICSLLFSCESNTSKIKSNLVEKLNLIQKEETISIDDLTYIGSNSSHIEGVYIFKIKDKIDFTKSSEFKLDSNPDLKSQMQYYLKLSKIENINIKNQNLYRFRGDTYTIIKSEDNDIIYYLLGILL